MAYKYQRLFEELKDMAKGLPQNAQLPSLRALMDRFDVSQATVDRAMDELRAEGMVVSIEGEGFFVASKGGVREPRKSLRICFAVNDYPSSHFAAVEESLKLFFEAEGHEFSVVRYPWTKSLSSVLKPGLMDALLALPPGKSLSQKESAFLKSLDIPSICLGVSLEDRSMDSVSSDVELGGMMAADLFIKKGHSKLAFLAGEPAGPSVDGLAEGFRRQAALAGLPEPLVIDCGTKHGEPSMARAYEGLLKTLKGGKPSFTALLAASDACAIGAIRAAHEAGAGIPSEIKLIGFNGIPEAAYCVPSLTTFRHDWEGWGKAALEIIRRRLSGDAQPGMARRLAPKQILRESC